jgi:2-pyrone-4,6-dicarboxylate lactonase
MQVCAALCHPPFSPPKHLFTMTKPCLGPLPPPASVPSAIPPLACDCHAHVFGPYAHFPLADERSYTPPENPAARFIAQLDATGFARGVVVTASVYGTDNRSLVGALQYAPTRLRGVAVIDSNASEAELDSLTLHGVRGARFNLYQEHGQKVYRNGAGLDDLRALAPRLAARGWHAQIWVHAPDLPELAPILRALSIPLVVDHMGRMNVARGTGDAGFQALVALLADGAAWTKISGADRISATRRAIRRCARLRDGDPCGQPRSGGVGQRLAARQLLRGRTDAGRQHVDRALLARRAGRHVETSGAGAQSRAPLRFPTLIRNVARGEPGTSRIMHPPLLAWRNAGPRPPMDHPAHENGFARPPDAGGRH